MTGPWLPPASAASETSRFRRDVVWNMASLAVLGICGILLNLLVGVFYSPAVLGVFNQVFAAYILFSQFAVLGLHYSALKHVAESPHDRARVSAITGAALLLAITLAVVTGFVFWAARSPIAAWLDSPGVATGIACATPGLVAFAVNKVVLGTLNGLRAMRTFAALQALRPVLMIAAFAGLAFRDASGDVLPIVFSVAEITVLALGTVALLVRLRPPAWSAVRVWLGPHLQFGVRSFFSGVLVELNTRVDVIMLGYFLTDEIVGIYSFAAILAEGLFQLLIVLRNNYNPVLVARLAPESRPALEAMIRRGKRVAWGLMAVVAVVAVAAYPLGIHVVERAAEFEAAWPLFAILMAGIVVAAGYIPFTQLLLQAGRPATHTLMVLAVVVFNLAGNAILIPRFAAMGAAIATALAFVFLAIIAAILSRIILGVRL